MSEVEYIKNMANLLRQDVLIMTTKAGSGHATSCLSSADIISSLFFYEMRFSPSNPNNQDNDEFVLSKGHAAPILYSALYHSGCISSDLLKLRKLESPLEGHPVPSTLGWIKVATGSLGQGLSVGLGMALGSKRRKSKSRVYVLLGDSECAEGSVYEALQLASYYNLDNLCAIVDVNRLGQRGPTMIEHDVHAYKSRFEAFGWEVQIVDGHNVKNILNALDKSRKSKRPSMIIAKTTKGKGVSFLEDKNGWHGKALTEEELKKALKQIPEVIKPEIKIRMPEHSPAQEIKIKPVKPNLYSLNHSFSTREAYGKALASLAQSDPNILAIDAEVSNSTFSELVKKATPSQFIECFIAEQNMISMGLGLSLKGFKVFASTFSAFASRAHDQLRMAAISYGHINVCGSHSGVSIGEDGASQMGLEDIALFRTLPNSTIFYPSDAVSAEKLTMLASQLKGIKYIRTSRPKFPVIYSNEEDFILGDFKVLRSSDNLNDNKKEKKSNKKKQKKPIHDKITLIGAGITLHECLKAHDILIKSGVHSAVIDLYSIKPFNSKKLIDFVKSHGNKIVVVEDHYKEGGIGEMLSKELSNTGIIIKTLAIDRVPHSGSAEQLLEKYGINSRAIVDASHSII